MNGSGVGGWKLPIGRAPRREGDRLATSFPRKRQCVRDLGRALVIDSERDRNVISLDDHLHLEAQSPALGCQSDRRERALADDHRMDELDRDVARVESAPLASRRERPACRPWQTALPSGDSSVQDVRPPWRRTRGSPRCVRWSSSSIRREPSSAITPGAFVESRRERARTGGGRPPALGARPVAIWWPARGPARAPGRLRTRPRSRSRRSGPPRIDASPARAGPRMPRRRPPHRPSVRARSLRDAVLAEPGE